jgi:small-conductance mechanosensitive channel
MLPSILLAAILQAQVADLPPPAVVRLGARVVTTLRSSLGASTPAERAEAAQTRILRLLEAGHDSVALHPTPEGMLVSLGGSAFMITTADVDSLAGETVATKAEAAAEQLRTAVLEYREGRSLRAVATGLGLSAVATVLLVVVIRLLRRLLRWVDRKASRLREPSLPARFRRLATVFNPRLAVRPIQYLTRALTWIVGLTLGYVYATFVLTALPWTRPWGERLGELLDRLATRLGWGLLEVIPDLVIVVLIALAAMVLSRGAHRLFEGVERGVITLPGLHPETANPTRRIVIILVWLLAIVIMYPYLPGSDSAAFKGASVFAGLLLSLGSAGLVGQAMSGLVLMYSRSYRQGDYVRVGVVEGTVEQLGLLSTRLRTPKDEYVVIPNAVVTGDRVTNFSAAGRAGHALYLHSSVTIGYDVPRATVERLLLAAGARIEAALPEPSPFVLVRALNDWHVEYQVNVAVDPERAVELPRLYSRLHGAIYDEFAEAGVEIMSPSYLALRDGNSATLPGVPGRSSMAGHTTRPGSVATRSGEPR